MGLFLHTNRIYSLPVHLFDSLCEGWMSISTGRKLEETVLSFINVIHPYVNYPIQSSYITKRVKSRLKNKMEKKWREREAQQQMYVLVKKKRQKLTQCKGGKHNTTSKSHGGYSWLSSRNSFQSRQNFNYFEMKKVFLSCDWRKGETNIQFAFVDQINAAHSSILLPIVLRISAKESRRRRDTSLNIRTETEIQTAPSPNYCGIYPPRFAN